MDFEIPGGIESLSDSILKAVKPFLKAPATASLCGNEELNITCDNDVYTIEGYVNSQNSYGAMIGTDFTVTARFQDGGWVLSKPVIGVKNAKKNAKAFASNYLIISIFVAAMGLLGYFLLSVIVG